MPSDRTQPVCQTSTLDFAATKSRRIRANARRGWRSAAGGVQLLLRGGLDPGVVLEELLVELDEVLPLLGSLVLGEDRLHRAHGLARAAVYALVGMDVEHRLTLVDAVDRAHLHACLVFYVDARLRDYVRHGGLPIQREHCGLLRLAKPMNLYPNRRSVSSIRRW